MREPKGHVNSGSGKSTVVRTVGSQSTPVSKSSTASRAPSTSKASRSSASTTSAGGPKNVPLVVLNNTTTRGLAHQAANRFEAGGWKVTRYANYTNDIISTCAYYDPNVSGAKAAAKALQNQYPMINRVQPKFAQLPSGPVVVVLTPGYASG